MSATGHWKLVIKTPFGEQKMKTELSEEGGTLIGSMDDDKNPAGPILDAAVNGNQLSWKFPVKKPFAATLAFTLKLDSDTLTGTCKAGVFPLAQVKGSRA